MLHAESNSKMKRKLKKILELLSDTLNLYLR